MKWPWVSREQYDAVLAAKDAVIHVLEDQNAVLARRLLIPMEVSVTLPEGFAVQMPAVVGRRPKQQSQDARQPAQETDWASIDENDPVALAKEAAKELRTTVPPHVLARTITQMKMTIRAAKRKKLEATLREGKVGTQTSPSTILTELEAIEEGPAYVPQHIRDEIAAAERG
jgi:hypothetical protein